MKIYIAIVCIVFAISLISPIYTYLLYPVILKFLKPKRFGFKEWSPSITVIKVGTCENGDTKCEYEYFGNKLEVLTAKDYAELNTCIQTAQGEVLLFSGADVEFSKNAIYSLIKKLSPKEVGAVCGQLRAYPDQNGAPKESLYWKYENLVKKLESNIGCLSGANQAIFAVKKALCPKLASNIINWDFYISMQIIQKGFAVLFDSQAVAFQPDSNNDDNEFCQHVKSGAGAYQSLAVFWRMLLPRKGSFVHVSHRVMKWLVPFNMIFLLLSSALLSVYSIWAFLFLLLQVAAYFVLLLYFILFVKLKKSLSGIIGKMLSLAVYFISLNLAWFIGMFKIKKFTSNEQL